MDNVLLRSGSPSLRRTLSPVRPCAKLLLKRDFPSQWCTSEFKWRLEKEEDITFSDAVALAELPGDRVSDLISLARKVTLKYKGDGVLLRSIISAQTENCPEDCSFCSRPAHFDTEVEAHPLMAAEKIL